MEIENLFDNQQVEQPEQPEQLEQDNDVDGEITLEDLERTASGENIDEPIDNDNIPQDDNYYTPEEIERIGIENLDPNKIPPEVRPFYKAMQADYTRKTQQLKQPEQQPEQPEQVEQQQNLVDVVAQQAKAIAEQMVGEEFDEFDPRHIAAYNMATQQVLQQINQQQQFFGKIEEIKQKEPNFDKIDEYAQQKLLNLPYGKAKQIEAALQRYDTDTLLKFWEECRKEWYNRQTNGQQVNPNQLEEPAKGRQATKIAPTDLAGLDDDQKAEALIKMGLV